MISADTYFHELISTITGVEHPDGRLVFSIKGGKVAELDRSPKGDLLWVHWTIFYLPFLTIFKMKESEVTKLIAKHLDVKLVRRYPSAARLAIIEHIEEHMELSDLIDGI